MTTETIAEIITELAREYSDVKTAREGNVALVRLPEVWFPGGCQPAMSAALVVLDPGQPAPRLLLKTLPRLKNGATPRSTGSETVAGEGWFSFSFNQPWIEDTHTGVQFVEARLRRFALDE